MSRTSYLKELADELRLLFDEDVSEQAAYNLLHNDPRFESLRLAKINTLYKQFRGEQGEKRNRVINPFKLLFFRQSELLLCNRLTWKCNHEQKPCLKSFHGNTLDGRFFVQPKSGENRSVIECSLEDLFNNKSKQFTGSVDAGESGRYVFYLLTECVGLAVFFEELDDDGSVVSFSLHLFQIDWTSSLIREIQKYTFGNWEWRLRPIGFAIDAEDPERFILEVLQDDDSTLLKQGQLVNDGIVFTDRVVQGEFLFYEETCYFNGNTLFSFDPDDLENPGLGCICIVDLEHGTVIKFGLEQFPEHLFAIHVEGDFVGCMVKNRLFLAVQFKRTNNFGIAWTDTTTRNWAFMDFCTKKMIIDIRFIAEGSFLLVQTLEDETKVVSATHEVRKSFYRIPLKKPEKLTNLAWFSLLRSKSKLNNVDPYEEARRYLPYTSEIQCPFSE